MKKIFNSKIFVGLVCFCLGFLANHFLPKLTHRSLELGEEARVDRFPVNPDDFDHDKMLDAMKRMQQDMIDGGERAFEVTGVNRREDEHFVYYEIPMNENEKNQHELKVSVKDGMISIAENTKNTQSERQFSIDSGLDETKANVETLKDKILIKIPKIK
ncbi:MAG: hypothetical protein ACXVLQ_10120 [Bacteriovorax sp.]